MQIIYYWGGYLSQEFNKLLTDIHPFMGVTTFHNKGLHPPYHQLVYTSHAGAPIKE